MAQLLLHVVGVLLYFGQPGPVPPLIATMWSLIISIFFIGSLLWFIDWQKEFRAQMGTVKTRVK